MVSGEHSLNYRKSLKPSDKGNFAMNRAMQMADEFPDVEVTGCDLAPIQPEYVQSDSRSPPPFSSFPTPQIRAYSYLLT